MGCKMISKRWEYDVSVIVPTYCHERYISQALDSILMQKTNLKYEILVGDDGSPDRTPQIVQTYADQYPDIMIPVLHKENMGATKNNWGLHLRARGKYIALLEGDDFWLDPYKMQKQYDFLEQEPEYIGCCSKCLIVDEESQPDYTLSCGFVWNKRNFSLDDFINSWKLPGQAGSRMCRNIYSDISAEESEIYCTSHSMVGDKTMMLFLLSRGPIYCSNEVLSAYRSVDKKGRKNWFSIHHANPYRNYDMFLYPCVLESWARKHGMRLSSGQHFGKQNPYRFARFVEECVREPSLRRFKYLGEMVVKSHQPLKYSWYLWKALIEME